VAEGRDVGGAFHGRSSHRRTATAALAYGIVSNSATSWAFIGPPWIDSVSADAADSLPGYPGTTAHR